LDRRQFLAGTVGAAGLVVASGIEELLPGLAPQTALAASYEEGAMIRRSDGTCWWLKNGERHWVPDGTTWYAIYYGNGRRSYNWSESDIYRIRETWPVPSRISTSGRAADWAIARIDSYNWGWGTKTECQRFVENAYGTSGRHPTAYDCGTAIGRKIEPSGVPIGNELLRGHIVFFEKDPSNGLAGHSGLFIGNGEFISVTASGVKIRSVSKWSQNVAPYLGHAEAPITWPGV
jgi:hypothetical protein